MTTGDLFALAEAEGRLTAEDSARVLAALAGRPARTAMPWYLHALVAIGAWLTALLLLAFLIFGAFSNVIEHARILGVLLGVALIACACAVQRAHASSVFLGQAMLAVSAAGHAEALISISEMTKSQGAVAACALLLAAAGYSLMKGGLHRFLACTAALLLLSAWAYNHNPLPQLVWLPASVLSALHLVAGAILFLDRRSGRRWRPLAYAVVISWLYLFLPEVLLGVWLESKPGWPLQVIVTVGLLGTVVWAARGISLREHRAAAIVLAAALGLGWIAPAPVLAALVLLVVGFGLQERPLLWLGGLLLPVFLFAYYYQLRWSLWQKSQLLMATGALLLVLQIVLFRLSRPRPESPAT